MMNLIRTISLIALLSFGGCSGSRKQPAPGLLVSGEWLKDHMVDSSMVLLHVGTREGFDTLHIPGARFLDPYAFTANTDSLRNELPGIEIIAGLLRTAGINSDSRIVLYYEDEDLITRTARVFLTLDYAGLGDRTFVLNGGLRGWQDGGGATTSDPSDSLTGDWIPGTLHEVIIRARDLDRQKWDPGYMVIDSRSTEEYFGEVDSTGQHASGGHIEGAYFMSYQSMLSDSIPYMFRTDEEIRKEFEDVGMDPDKTAIYYCGSGVRAAVNYLAARHLGYPALLYDGSFQEWEALELPLVSPVLDPSKTE